LTHSERKWLVEQMASQRRRPAPSDRSADAEESSSVIPAPPTIEPSPPSDPVIEAPPRAAMRERTTRRPPRGTPGPHDSFWSFG